MSDIIDTPDQGTADDAQARQEMTDASVDSAALVDGLFGAFDDDVRAGDLAFYEDDEGTLYAHPVARDESGNTGGFTASLLRSGPDEDTRIVAIEIETGDTREIDYETFTDISPDSIPSLGGGHSD